MGEMGLEISAMRSNDNLVSSSRSSGSTSYAVVDGKGEGSNKGERAKGRNRRRSSLEDLGNYLKDGIKKLVGA